MVMDADFENVLKTMELYTGISYFFFSFKLEANCFTMLCWFLPYNIMNQS